MAMPLITDTRLPSAEPVERDGLLAYLHALARVAHAPAASHWCTPGHNRGRALENDPAMPTPPVPFVLVGGKETR